MFIIVSHYSKSSNAKKVKTEKLRFRLKLDVKYKGMNVVVVSWNDSRESPWNLKL